MRHTWRNFTYGEFACPCPLCRDSGTNIISPTLITMLQNARDHANRIRRHTKFNINSGYRCLEYNRSIGSKDTSSHIKGLAADIATTNSGIRFAIIPALYKAGFTRIGFGNGFIHVDIDKDKATNTMWDYY